MNWAADPRTTRRHLAGSPASRLALLPSALALLLVLVPVAARAGGGLEGTWSNEAGTFVFSPQGTAQIVMADGQAGAGQWSLQGNVLRIALPGGELVFEVQVNGDVLFLRDANGVYGFQRGSAGPQPAPPRAGGGSPPAPAGRLSDAQFVRLIETYRTMHPDEVTKHVAAMTETQAWTLDLHDALGAEIYTRVCKGSSADRFVWNHFGQRKTCRDLLIQEQQTLALLGTYGGRPGEQADRQKQEVMMRLRCARGELSQQECAMHRQLSAEMDQMWSEIGASIIRRGGEDMQVIIDNMCTPTYDADGNYVDCY